jgi:serine/threonine-protein kinase RsbW
MHSYIKPTPIRTITVDLDLEPYIRRVRFQTRAEARLIFDQLEDGMRTCKYVYKDIFAVKLALDEAVSNALRHGNRGNPCKYVQINYLVTPAEVWLEIQDEGAGFNPAEVPDPLAAANVERPGGRGLFLMRAYMDAVSFNTQGNRVTLCRRRTGA